MQWWRDWKPHKWIDVHFALEQFSGTEGNKDGILFIYYNYYDEKKVRNTVSVRKRSQHCIILTLKKGKRKSSRLTPVSMEY